MAEQENTEPKPEKTSGNKLPIIIGIALGIARSLEPTNPTPRDYAHSKIF